MKQFFTGLSVFLGVVAAHGANLQCDASVVAVRGNVTHERKTVTSWSYPNTTQIDGVKFQGVTPDGKTIWLQMDAGALTSRILAVSGQKLQMKFTLENGDSGVASLQCATR